MKKVLLIGIIALYLFIMAIWFYRFPISYSMTTGIDPNLFTHDLTNEDRDNIEKAYRIRQSISVILLYSSLILAAGSYFALRVNWLKQRLLMKAVLVISAIVFIVLMLVNGIHFIPGPPIR